MPVHRRGAGDLAHADHQHLDDAGLDRRAEIRVRLDPTNQRDRVGFRSVPVTPDGRAVGQLAELDDLHARPDRTAHGRFIDPEATQHLDLAFGGCRAVTAHGRKNKRLRAQRLQFRDDCFRALRDIGDPARAATDSDAHARLNPCPQLRPTKLLDDGGGNVVDFLVGEFLADLDHSGQVDVESTGDVDFDTIPDHEPLPCFSPSLLQSPRHGKRAPQPGCGELERKFIKTCFLVIGPAGG